VDGKCVRDNFFSDFTETELPTMPRCSCPKGRSIVIPAELKKTHRVIPCRHTLFSNAFSLGFQASARAETKVETCSRFGRP